MSSARPAQGSSAALTAGANGAHVVVLDTGLAGSDLAGKSFRPAALGAPSKLALISGENDVPDAKIDGWLDEVAGHGTFIAGLIEQHAPGTRVEVLKLVNDEGLVDTDKLHTSLLAIATRPVAGANAKADVPTRPLLLNLSFGGYVDEVDYKVVEAITKCQGAGITVVASAGNEGWCEPIFPAAIPGVISVGSLGPEGPSVFSNYGRWVRCAAPGEDLVSTFFSGWNGSNPKMDGGDKDQFDGWAVWSGTSFSAPTVVAALIRKWLENGNDMMKAIHDLIDAPHLARIPGLGTVVNL